MEFFSTRNKNEIMSGAKAIIKGMASDGGLYVPSKFKDISEVLTSDKCYDELCIDILKIFFEELDLEDDIKKAYQKFYKNPPAQVNKVGDKYLLELFHGPTSAFKDFALVVLPQLLKHAIKYENNNENTVILTATSGDTGKAALEGFASLSRDTGIDIVVIYPQDGVSAVQKRQMITQEGSNVTVIGIHGNFDDAQSSVKAVFADKALSSNLKEKNISFSSANSINIGRLVPQIAYYFEAYRQLLKNNEIKLGDKLSFCVPTGNFGDILAGYYAQKMGLPVDKLICASNENDVLVDFFESGIYDKNRNLKCTKSPSMDIVVSSNLERLLYHISKDTAKVKIWMDSLEKEGRYSIFSDDRKENDRFKNELNTFLAKSADKARAYKAIKETFDKYGYLMDTHTAVAYDVATQYQLDSKVVILSTASPFKFASSVCEALEIDFPEDEFETLKALSSYSNLEIPKPLRGLDKKEVLHNTVIEKTQIKEKIEELLLGEERSALAGNLNLEEKLNLKIRVPATTANIGPGFDSLGIALNLYSEMYFEAEGLAQANDSKDIELLFENVEKEFANRDNLVFKSFVTATELISGSFPKKLKLKIQSDIPVCRGLGSSAACIAAGVKAAFEISKIEHNSEDVLKISNMIEGHPDNVAPAIMGGFRASMQEEQKVYSVNLEIDKEMQFFALVPDFKLSTEYSRSVLPKSVEFKDVVYNLSHLSLMIGAFANKDYKVLKSAISDKIHQDFRASLIDEYDKVMDICSQAGAKAVFLSGAGPTIMAIDDSEADKFEEYQKLVLSLKNNWKVYKLNLDLNGISCKKFF